MATSHSLRLSSISFTRKPSTGSSCRLLYSWARALWALVDRFWLLAINDTFGRSGGTHRETPSTEPLSSRSNRPYAWCISYVWCRRRLRRRRGARSSVRGGSVVFSGQRRGPDQRGFTLRTNDAIRDDVAADSRRTRTAHYRLHVNNNNCREPRGPNCVQNLMSADRSYCVYKYVFFSW